MTVFEEFQNKNIDELVAWLDEYGQFDKSPWQKWFGEKYCNNCESVMSHYKGSELLIPFAWCELNGKCKYFQDMDDNPYNKDVIKMWLQTEVE